ncbi:MAG TPA: hypothetical protein VJ755_06960 [Gemmatimonadales bacterium]|nr:hypothetical protein [Gemmatimonadales bacterium]
MGRAGVVRRLLSIHGFADRLRRRGILVSDDERPEELADLLAAVEGFEKEVEARGGDLMVASAKVRNHPDLNA